MTFKRKIGSFGLLAAGISSVIGSGWLFGPLYAAQIAGPAAFLSWIIGGVMMMVIMLTFVELGSAFPVAGGLVQYAQQSQGSLITFIIGWMIWVSSLTVAPVETLGLIQYLANYVSGLVVKIDNGHVLTHKGIAVASLVMLLMCILNSYGAHFFNRFSTVITIFKLVVPISTVFILLMFHFDATNFSSASFAPYGLHGIFAALPLGGVIYSFIGSNSILHLAGEVKNPQRSLPIALMGSMVFCLVLYALLQIAYIGALSPSAFVDGWKTLHYAGDSGPFSGMMITLGIAWFVTVIYIDAIISPFGTGYVFTAAAARIGYGLSEVGFLPLSLKKLTKRSVPLNSIIVNYFVGLLLFLPFPAWQKMVSFIISCFILSYIIGPLALITLRRKQPKLHRPFVLPFPFLISFLAFYFCNLLILWTGWQTVYKMGLAMLAGLFIYFCMGIKDKQKLKDWRISWWIIPYFSGLLLISYLATFGGGTGIITFGLDFLVTALLSLIIFLLAIYLHKMDDGLSRN